MLRGTSIKTVQLFAAAVLALSCITARALPDQKSATLQGEVLEVRNVESYTYLRLRTGEGEIWAAVPTATVARGAKVRIVNSMTMENFESKSLKKKFDRIVFGVMADASGGPSAPMGAAPSTAALVPKVAKATGSDAKNVAEVVQGRAVLKDKSVVVRGQVVKMNAGILGKNWVHLQDGTGSVADGTHDVLVTTNDRVSVGDVVTAKGVVRTDVNLGSGYVYAVVIQDAAVRK